MDKTNYALAILEKLNKARKANKRNRIKKSQEIGPSLPPGSAPISPPIPDSPEHHSPSKTEGSLPLNPSPVHSYTSKIREKASGVSQGILSVFGAAVGADLGLSVGVILRTPADAKKLAKKLFESLCKRSEEVIIPSDFEPYFSSKEDASTAFRIFDRDGNGEVSKHEMKVTILETFRDNQSLENSIRQSSQAIKKLDSILMVIVIIIALFVCLSIWNVNTTSYLVTFATVWASIVFSVSNVISSLVQSIILLFVSHPYDVGDRVDIDNESFTVVKFGLTSTTFRRSDGKECYVPNSSLTSKTICNIRRSGPQNEKVELVISSDTPHEKINELQTLLLDYLTNEETKDFAPKIDIVIKDIIDNRSMTISMSLEHKTNWQEGGKKSQRRNRFMWKLKELVSQAGIQLIGHEKN